ncbi:hypothetical protein BURMUCF1_A1203 [Burkholderia multivorans ATCC BAA-247]|nr:hypothetical protein BURMUCF1_A1203 [Burkholderia multivorans ATCC BAA-247]
MLLETACRAGIVRGADDASHRTGTAARAVLSRARDCALALVAPAPHRRDGPRHA